MLCRLQRFVHVTDDCLKKQPYRSVAVIYYKVRCLVKTAIEHCGHVLRTKN